MPKDVYKLDTAEKWHTEGWSTRWKIWDDALRASRGNYKQKTQIIKVKESMDSSQNKIYWTLHPTERLLRLYTQFWSQAAHLVYW